MLVFLQLLELDQEADAPCAAAGVCRRWRNIAISCSSLWGIVFVTALEVSAVTNFCSAQLPLQLQRVGTVRPVNVLGDLGIDVAGLPAYLNSARAIIQVVPETLAYIAKTNRFVSLDLYGRPPRGVDGALVVGGSISRLTVRDDCWFHFDWTTHSPSLQHACIRDTEISHIPSFWPKTWSNLTSLELRDLTFDHDDPSVNRSHFSSTSSCPPPSTSKRLLSHQWNWWRKQSPLTMSLHQWSDCQA